MRLDYDAKPEYRTVQIFRAFDREGPWHPVGFDVPSSGTWVDRTPDGQKVFYRLVASSGERNASRVVASDGVTPSSDPVPPSAHVLIDGGALYTCSSRVELSFAAKEHQKLPTDVVEVVVANDPLFSDAIFLSFAESIGWNLGRRADGELATVYVILRDRAGNTSSVEAATIRYRPRDCERR